MFEYLDKVRKKDEKIKKRIAFYVALACAAFIFIIWLTVSVPQIKNEKRAQDAIASTTKSPLSNFMAIISNGLIEAQKNVSEIKSAINVLSSTTAYYYSTTSSETASSTIKIDQDI
ncbi:MAG: hypothetical protein WAW92_01665 [Minisyncoccia bacterium]